MVAYSQVGFLMARYFIERHQVHLPLSMIYCKVKVNWDSKSVAVQLECFSFKYYQIVCKESVQDICNKLGLTCTNCITQFLESYKSVTMKSMAEAFSVSEDFLDREISNFIVAGRLHAKIDKVTGVIETNR